MLIFFNPQQATAHKIMSLVITTDLGIIVLEMLPGIAPTTVRAPPGTGVSCDNNNSSPTVAMALHFQLACYLFNFNHALP
jgi:hypothetical protein